MKTINQVIKNGKAILKTMTFMTINASKTMAAKSPMTAIMTMTTMTMIMTMATMTLIMVPMVMVPLVIVPMVMIPIKKMFDLANIEIAVTLGGIQQESIHGKD
jgi:hypothetical protein